MFHNMNHRNSMNNMNNWNNMNHNLINRNHLLYIFTPY